MSQHHAPFDPRETLEPYTEIYPGLHVGRRPETYVGYDLAVSCEKHLARKPMEGYAGLTVHLPMEDLDTFPLDRRRLDLVADLVGSVLDGGGRVLIHCTGGLNRSGLLATMVIQRYRGGSHRSALMFLRSRRDRWMVCNPHFERWLSSLD